MYTSKKYGILIIIMAVIIFLGILTGCGKSDDNKKNSSSDGEMSSREVGDTQEDPKDDKQSKEGSESGTDKQEELSSEEVEAGEYKTILEYDISNLAEGIYIAYFHLSEINASNELSDLDQACQMFFEIVNDSIEKTNWQRQYWGSVRLPSMIELND